jgi:hypothetical protein
MLDPRQDPAHGDRRDEPNPYAVFAAEGEIPGPRKAEGVRGAVLVFVAAVVVPFAFEVADAALLIIALQRAQGRSTAMGSLELWLPAQLVAACLGVVLVAGAYRLTAEGSTHGISGGLRGGTRLACAAQVVTITLVAAANALHVKDAYATVRFAAQASREIAEALLAFVAARHLARLDRPKFAWLARALAVALLAWIFARWALFRWMGGDMRHRFALGSQLLRMGMLLWFGKLFVFGRLASARTAANPHL